MSDKPMTNQETGDAVRLAIRMLDKKGARPYELKQVLRRVVSALCDVRKQNKELILAARQEPPHAKP